MIANERLRAVVRSARYTLLHAGCITEAEFTELAKEAVAIEDGQPRQQEGQPQPFAYVCPANCGCMWRDNRDGTMSLFGKRNQSCAVCEPLPLSELVPVYREASA